MKQVKRKHLLALAATLLPLCAQADDWGGTTAPIDMMYIYPTYALVIQGSQAGCANNNAWSFQWTDFDEDVRKRVYATLLTAKLSRAPIRPIFSSAGCGPEGVKKFTGHIAIY